MTEAVRLYIITDDAEKAALSELGCWPSEVPWFFRILTEAKDIAAIPDGSRCIGRWFRWSDKRPTPAQYAWLDRREAGGIEGVSEAFYARIDEWNDKRRATEAALLAEALGEARPAVVTAIPAPDTSMRTPPQPRYT